MKCPRCVQKIHRGAEQCPHCGFSVADLDDRLGRSEVRMRVLSDEAGVLRIAERRAAERVLKRFQKVFPQLFFSVYYGSLDERTNIRQFGMWLLNHAAFEDVPITKPNEGAVLLIVDVKSKTATISSGYLLDVFLTEQDTFQVLSCAHPYLMEGEHLKALEVMVKKMTVVLRKRSRQGRSNPEKYRRLAGVNQQGMSDVMQPIRPNDLRRKANKRPQPLREEKHL